MIQTKTPIPGLALLFYLFSFAAPLFSQTQILMPYNNGPVTEQLGFPDCSFLFSDNNGGTAGRYSNSSGIQSVITFAPSNPNKKIQVTFTSFNTESTWDALFVFDGETTDAPKIASTNGNVIGGSPWGTGGWWGTVAPNNTAPNQVKATNASGALTFAFYSDASVNLAGWQALVTEELIESPDCGIVPGEDLYVSSSPATLPTPQFTGNCSGFVLEYRINGGALTVVGTEIPPSIEVEIPSGLNVITWIIVDACTGVVIDESNQTVIFSVEATLAQLMDDVGDLGLSSGLTNSLTTKLENALNSYLNCNLGAAINKIEAFINQVQALVNSGHITEAEGAALIASAQTTIDLINAVGNPACRPGTATSRQNEQSSMQDFTVFPNPAAGATQIDFQLSQAGEVTLQVFDVNGRVVKTLFQGHREAGQYQATWGEDAVPGTYVIMLNADGQVSSKRLIRTE